MTFLKLTIRPNPSGGALYPDAYDAKKVDRFKKGPIVMNHGLAEGKDQAEYLIYVRDKYAAEILDDPHIEKLTQSESADWLEANDRDFDRAREVVQDEQRIQAIQTKLLAKQAGEDIDLTAEDRQALDPDSDVAGVNKRPVGLEKFGLDHPGQ